MSKGKKKKKDEKPACQPGNWHRDSTGHFSSKKNAVSYTTGEAPSRSDCFSGKGQMRSGERTKKEDPCGRGPGLKGRSGFLCKNGEVDLNEEKDELRTIVEEEIRLALTRIFTRMNTRQEVRL